MAAFTKGYSSPFDLVQLLKSRGLIITDEQRAEAYITNIGYYRLSAYMLPFLTMPKTNHIFKPGVTFDNVLDLYRFDKKLRVLLFNEIEKIEIAFREAVANVTARMSGDIFWMTDSKYFKNQASYTKTFAIIDSEYNKSTEDFIKHFYKDAAEYMQNVYDMILDQNTYYNYAIDPGAGTIQSYPTLTQLYPKAFVEKMEEQLQLGLEAIAHYRETDPEMYELLESRIMKEYLNVYYWQGMVYGDSYSEEELAEIREQWLYWTDYFQINAGSEGGVMPEF